MGMDKIESLSPVLGNLGIQVIVRVWPELYIRNRFKTKPNLPETVPGGDTCFEELFGLVDLFTVGAETHKYTRAE